ncbi:hypothetical protein C7I55_18990 [Sphingomonas deserti]|uniref:Uncharacterized protein n=1 Tax=Allosphingosinicella deserti TaxID=2116704 RepID=A0A2P7QKM8_9SPHN|nr:hypothetical protein C7I55_18990 [Sphingomonas deserti]
MTKGYDAACAGAEPGLSPDRKSAAPGAKLRDENARRVQVRAQLRSDIDTWLKRSTADCVPCGIRPRVRHSKSD